MPLVRASAQICLISADDRVEHAGQLLVDRLRLVPFDEVRLVAHALEELLQLVLAGCGPGSTGWRSCSR